jgi:hypothetical protein
VNYGCDAGTVVAAGALLPLVMVLLVIGLVTATAGGTFARLIETHPSVAAAASTSVGERIGILDARARRR